MRTLDIERAVLFSFASTQMSESQKITRAIKITNSFDIYLYIYFSLNSFEIRKCLRYSFFQIRKREEKIRRCISEEVIDCKKKERNLRLCRVAFGIYCITKRSRFKSNIISLAISVLSIFVKHDENTNAGNVTTYCANRRSTQHTSSEKTQVCSLASYSVCVSIPLLRSRGSSDFSLACFLPSLFFSLSLPTVDQFLRQVDSTSALDSSQYSRVSCQR